MRRLRRVQRAHARVAPVLRLRGPALYYFPPAAWLDRAAQARKVARVASDSRLFAHQARLLSVSLGLRSSWFGHPLVSRVAPRAPHRARGDRRSSSSCPAAAKTKSTVICRCSQRRRSDSRATRLGARFRVVAASDALARQIGARWPQACGPVASRSRSLATRRRGGRRRSRVDRVGNGGARDRAASARRR